MQNPSTKFQSERGLCMLHFIGIWNLVLGT